MSKEIDQLDLSTAKEIYKWLIAPNMPALTDSGIKAHVRNYLRIKRLSPYEALEKIRKQNASMPKRIF